MKIPQILTLILKRNVMQMRMKTKMNMPGGKTRLMDIKKGATPCSNLC